MVKLKLLLIAICLVFYSCEKEYFIENIYGKIFILGHGGRGVGFAPYPLNSYESISSAIYQGADGSEIDVQISKDSVLVCFHDKYLEEATDGSGEIYTKSWDEIKHVKYKSPPYEEIRVVSLEQVIYYLNGRGSYFTFDIKFNNPDHSETNRDIFHRAIIRLVEKYQLEDVITIESGDVEFLLSLREKKDDLRLFVYSDYETALEAAIEYNFSGITVKSDQLSKEKVLNAHDSGLLVATFSATRKNHDEIIKQNVDIIQTDDLNDLVNKLR